MAKRNLAIQPNEEEIKQPRKRVIVSASDRAGQTADLDRLIHERTRLAIISALAVNEVMTFNDLKALLNTTDGNLSVHARKLEEGDYLVCTKTFDGRIPKTEFSLTKEGKQALERYLGHMEALIKATRQK